MSQGLAQLRVNKNYHYAPLVRGYFTSINPTHDNKSCPYYQLGLSYFVQENNRVG